MILAFFLTKREKTQIKIWILFLFISRLLLLLSTTTTIAIAMKVHPNPLPKKRNNITIQYDMSAMNSNSNSSSRNRPQAFHKKLRRLPHIFSRVLELPFRSDADVSIEESADSFRFVAETDGSGSGEVRAHTVEIHPGVTKIVVRESGSHGFTLDELELDVWRFRLPETTRPELASAVFVDGELIVTVPKGGGDGVNGGGGDGGEEVWGDGKKGGFRGGNIGGTLVLVQ